MIIIKQLCTALLHNTPLRGGLGIDHVLTIDVSIWFCNTSCKWSSKTCFIWMCTP